MRTHALLSLLAVVFLFPSNGVNISTKCQYGTAYTSSLLVLPPECWVPPRVVGGGTSQRKIIFPKLVTLYALLRCHAFDHRFRLHSSVANVYLAQNDWPRCVKASSSQFEAAEERPCHLQMLWGGLGARASCVSQFLPSLIRSKESRYATIGQPHGNNVKKGITSISSSASDSVQWK